MNTDTLSLVKLSPNQRITRMRLSFVLGALIIGFCIWMAMTIAFQIAYGLTADRWPTTTGIITKSDIHILDKAGPIVSYEQYFRYEYELAGRKYSNSNLRFIDGGLSLRKIKKQEKKYPVGESITVYVHPKNPQVAVLEPGIRLKATSLLVLGLIVMMGFLLYFIKVLREDYLKVQNAKLEDGFYIIQRFANE